MKYKHNNRKYQFPSGIAVRDTTAFIPDDEPVFILRAKDVHAVETLEYYKTQCDNIAHANIIQEVIKDFIDFESENLDIMKEPDSPASSTKAGAAVHVAALQKEHADIVKDLVALGNMMTVEKMQRAVSEFGRVKKNMDRINNE